MNIIARYTRANIKSNRTRIPLIVLCIAIAALMFGASIVVPLIIRNFAEEETRSLYGSSDIYIADSVDNSNPVTSLYHIPQEITDASEYIAGVFVLPGTVQFGGKTKSANVLGVNYEDLEMFNPPVIEEGSVHQIGQNEMIVSRYYADTNNVKIGDKCKFVYAGRSYTIKVIAIAENSGLFKWKSSNNIVVSKATVNAIIGSAIPVNAMFNICVIKLKDASIENQEWAKGVLKEAYPDWSVDSSTDVERIDTIMKNNVGPLTICTSIVIVYCIFIIMLTMEIVFGERTRQFATMKCLGASKGMQLKSIIYESLFYGLVGGLLGTLLSRVVLEILYTLPDRYIFQGITFEYYLAIFIFSFILSVFCSITPAIKTLRQSIRQTMLSKKPSKLSLFLLQIISFVVLVTGIIIAIIQPIGRYIYFSPIVFLAIFISALILIPYILRYAIMLVTKIFKFNSFSVIYTQNSFLSASLKVVSRILFFSLFLITFLVAAVDTLKDMSSAQLQVDYYTMSIDNIYDGNGDFIIQELKVQSFVDKAMPTTVHNNSHFVIDGKKETIFSLTGMSIEDIKYAYNDFIVSDKTEVFDKLSSGRNYIVPNVRYKYINNLEIGDEVELIINLHGKEIKTEVIIAGFMDTYEEGGHNAVMNMQMLMDISQLGSYNSVFVKCDPEDLDLVIEHVQKRFGNAYTINKFYENQQIKSEINNTPIVIFSGYILLIIGMSIVFVVSGLYLALRRSLPTHKTMNILGMGTKQFVKTNFYQIGYISIGVSIITSIIVTIIKNEMINMFMLYNQYYRVVLGWGSIFLNLGITIAIIMIISTLITYGHSKKFEIHRRESDE